MSISWSSFLAWYRPSSSDDAMITRVFRSTKRHAVVPRARALAEAAFEDALTVPRDAPVWVLEHLAVIAVSAESVAGRALPDTIAAFIEKILNGMSLVDALGADDDECAQTLETVLTAIMQLDVVAGVECDCLQEAISHAHWGWHGRLAERVPAFIDLLLGAIDRDNFAISLLAAAALKAFAVVMAVPCAAQRSALVCAVLHPTLVSRDDGVRVFVTAVCRGACFFELAGLAAATCHEDLLTTFVTIAPESAVTMLHDALRAVGPASIMAQA